MVAFVTDQAIVGSKEKAKNGYGQNGSAQPSSLLPGQTKSPIANVSPPAASVPGLRSEDQLGARVHIGADGMPISYPSSSHFHPRGVDSGSPGGAIGSKTNHAPKR